MLHSITDVETTAATEESTPSSFLETEASLSTDTPQTTTPQSTTTQSTTPQSTTPQSIVTSSLPQQVTVTSQEDIVSTTTTLESSTQRTTRMPNNSTPRVDRNTGEENPALSDGKITTP